MCGFFIGAWLPGAGRWLAGGVPVCSVTSIVIVMASLLCLPREHLRCSVTMLTVSSGCTELCAVTLCVCENSDGWLVAWGLC